MKNVKKEKEDKFSLDESLPHQTHAPSWKGTGVKMKEPFLNDYGVVIGDSNYNSEHSPLNNWSDEIDPAIMSGEQWVHQTNDIGWNTPENRELLEEKRKPNGVPFTHPDKDVSYNSD
nr:DUF3905 domain-containing protein [Metabacillus niabensis]